MTASWPSTGAIAKVLERERPAGVYLAWLVIKGEPHGTPDFWAVSNHWHRQVGNFGAADGAFVGLRLGMAE